MTGFGASPGHLLAVGCFLVLAGLRAAEGSWVWAGVYALAALAQGVVGARLGRAPAGPRPPAGGPALQRQVRTWRLLTVSSCVVGAALLLVQPPLGLVAAAVALYCLRAARVHRPAA
jgi:hypothetical protein